ncbi:MAG: PEGA domain-containing protein [Deltaproteobacteria bacterium]
MVGLVAIVVVAGLDADPAELRRTAARAITTHTTLDVSADDLFAPDLSRETVAACATDDRCFRARIRDSGFGGRYVVVISAADSPAGAVSAVRVVDAEGRTVGRASGALIPGALDAQLKAAFPSEVWGAVATVAIRSAPAGATATFDGRRCQTPCPPRRVAPGRHDVRIEQLSYEPFATTFDVRRGDDHVIDAVLNDVPARPVYTRWWFWTAAAAVVAAGVTTAVVVGTRSGPTDVCLGGGC